MREQLEDHQMRKSRVSLCGIVLAFVIGIPGVSLAQTAANSGTNRRTDRRHQRSGHRRRRGDRAQRGHESDPPRDVRRWRPLRGVRPAARVVRVTATASGLETAVQTVVVTLGASASANFAMKVAGVSEDVEVGARRTALEPSGTQGKAVLTELQLQNLPASRTPRPLAVPADAGDADRAGVRRLRDLRAEGAVHEHQRRRRRLHQHPLVRARGVLADLQPRGAAGVPGASQHLLGGVRPLDRRHHQSLDQVRNEPAARHRLLPVPQRRDDDDRPVRPPADRVGQQFGGSVGGAAPARTGRSISSRPSSRPTPSRSRSSTRRSTPRTCAAPRRAGAARRRARKDSSRRSASRSRS